MRKLALIICALALVLSLFGCAKTQNTISFTAKVESINDGSITVTTEDDVEFEQADVSFSDGFQPDFEIKQGQTVKIEILPEIRESFPVQVTAVNISLEGESNMAVYNKITPEVAKEMMDGNVVILDVRTEEEFKAGHIEGAILIPNTNIAKDAPEILIDKDDVILVYCRSGKRSALAAKELVGMGYTQVYDFGGIIDWTYDVIK